MYKNVVFFAASLIVFLFWILYLANTGSDSVFFDLIKMIPYGDKVGHICLFGLITLVMIFATKHKAMFIKGRKIYYGAMMVITFVVVEEFTQLFIATRHFELIDLVADAIGITTASFVAHISEKYGKNWIADES